MRHGGKILIDQLERQGAQTAFTVPGESFLAALDGLHDTNQIRTIICRQEGGASIMAEAWGKMTGEPGVCFVTRGPGAANAMAGLHIAQQDSTPMVMFLGLPGERHEDREAFQEIETKQLFSSFVKWSAVIRSTARIPEYVSRAYHVARSGRPGPVVLGLPEDMLSARAEAIDNEPAMVGEAAPRAEAMAAVAAALAKAERPVAIVGGPGWSADVKRRLEAVAGKLGLPVAAAFRFQDYFDNRHPCYAGHAGIGIEAGLKDAIVNADLIVAIGARLGEMTTSGYTLIDIPSPRQALIHVHPQPDEIGTVYRPDVAVASSAREFVAALEGLAISAKPQWRQHAERLHAGYLKSLEPVTTPGAVRLEEVIGQLSRTLPDDAVITNGAGNYAAFVHRYFAYKAWRTQLAPTSGSMGYGLPAAIAAKLAAPGRTVVNFAGDGCFMMTAQEMATAVQYGLDIVTIVANNGMYGTIRMHQERHYPGRVVGTSLVNPDFAMFARSFGGHGETVERTEDFAAAFERAVASRKPAIIELKIDPEALSPRATLSEIRGGKR
ncbi:MAG: thiamine pyrophosphate-binding protein [Hyphomicrobiaceae bacterium]